MNFFQIFNRLPKDTFQPFVIATDEEELSILNNMRKVIVRGIAHVNKIDRRCSIASCSILISFSSRLDYQVGEHPIKNGIEGVDVDLVESLGGFVVRREEGVSVVRIAENVKSRAITSNKLVFPL